MQLTDEMDILVEIEFKKVIWTHELSSPKLLSNDGELFVNSARFRLESVEPFLPTATATAARTDAAVSIIKKHYILAICPTRAHDTGWYSCTVVKRNLNDPSVKYYTYLSVIAAPESHSREYASDDDDDDNGDIADDEYDDEYADFEQTCKDKEIVFETTTHFDVDSVNSSLVDNDEEDLKSRNA